MSLKSSDSHRRVLGEAPHERKVGLTGRKGGAHYGVRRGLLVTGVAVSVLLAGCSAAGPSASGTVSSSAGPTAPRSATPTPTPVMMCAPDNERRACTPEELEHAEDFLAVTAQHDAFTEEMNEWLMSGAPEDSVPRFEQYADGEVLRCRCVP